MRHAYKLGNKILKKIDDIRLIHATTYGAAIPASLLAKRHNKKVVLTVHEIFNKLRKRYKTRPQSMLYQLFEKIIFLLPYSHIHCVSYYTYNSLRLVYGVADREMSVIHNGIDTFWSEETINHKTIQTLRKKFAMDDFTKNYLYYGHSGKSKWLDYLIKALPSLVSKHHSSQFILNIIDAKRDREVRQMINSLGLKNNVRVLNGLPKVELKHLVKTVDAVIAPSLSEWFWSVHTETVSMGTPLITTAVGPLPEVLWWEVHWLQPSSTESILHTIDNFAHNNKHKKIPTKHFCRDKTVTQITALYNELLTE